MATSLSLGLCMAGSPARYSCLLKTPNFIYLRMYLGRQPILYLFIFNVNLFFFLCMCVGVNIYAHEGSHESAYVEDRGTPRGVYPHLQITLRWDPTVLLLRTPDALLLASSLCLLYPCRSPEITAFVWALGFQALDLRNAGKYFYPLKHFLSQRCISILSIFRN